MITGLSLANFKGSKYLDINIEPLTLLSGLNSAGKSTVLQSLCLARQSFGAEGAVPNAVELRGPLVEFGVFRDLISHGAETDSVSIGIRSEGGAWLCAFTADLNQSFATAFELEGTFPRELIGSDFQLLLADRAAPATRFPTPLGRHVLAGKLGARGEFTADVLARSAMEPEPVPVTRQAGFDAVMTGGAVGIKVAPTASLLDQVSAWLQYISPGVRVRAETIATTDDVKLVFEYVGRRGLEETATPIRPTNVGFGLTYVLPVIVAALTLPRGGTLLLENPEAHLHPRGQFYLGVLLAKAAHDGVQVLVESHSDHVLNGIRVSAKQRIIAGSSVAFHYFTRDIETGGVAVESPPLMDDGSIPVWPAGFFDEWDNALMKLLE